MYRFQIVIHAAPHEVEQGEVMDIAGDRVQTLAVAPTSLDRPLQVSFEDAVEALNRLPRMFIEGDGALLWAGGEGPSAWQVEGTLFDRSGRLIYVELKGACPAGAFDAVLAALGWPETPLVFQLSPQAVFVGEAEFRKLAEKAPVPRGE